MAGVIARRIKPEMRDEALALLELDPVGNLLLIDLVLRLASPPSPGEAATELLGAWRGDELLAVAALRPTLVFSVAPPEVLEAFFPSLESIGIGLMKSSSDVIDTIWRHLARRRRRHVLLDRLETAYVVRASDADLSTSQGDAVTRAAFDADLDALVVAARESLREEDRPDPFSGDVKGFKRWVQGRVERARVVERGGTIVCVGYADVRLTTGWLLQGVYCWPDVRRRGFATAGVTDLCREAFAAGADHVQLAVVDGNTAGVRLYERLGFKPIGKLRTVLFS
ncbi:MAG: GNAT family N-acetyltransferase [Deltaproteobacteria bacterium]|nr:GNAT family N-acetyltransferase [Deltaproteobacteria bacterium]MBW2398110.1 GNAT family N-acetyltransferase [Deltaproteobacteria bacterium]